MRKWFGLFLIAFLIMGPISVGAHSYVIDSNPADGDEVAATVDEIVLIFNAGIESISTATILNEAKEEVTVEKITVESPTLTVSLTEPLSPGRYVVEWRALGEDTHQTEGDLSFEIIEHAEADVSEEPIDLEEDMIELEQEEQLEETTLYTDDEDGVEASAGRFLLPILITGAIGLIFLVRLLTKRIS